ncbi:MAG: HAD family phosphatase [Pirellulales bacterium]|nr:HAD family phosphatase [Pirellulales bacterium]
MSAAGGWVERGSRTLRPTAVTGNRMNSPIRAVVFDLDGLLFNTEELYHYVGSELLARRGLEFAPSLRQSMMGRPAPAALRLMIEHCRLHETAEALAAEAERLVLPWLDRHLAPMPGAAELLDALERVGVPKAVATSSSRRFTQQVLGPFGWEPRFAFLLTAEDVVQGKPHPEIYLKAAELLRVPASEMAVLEDSVNGCRAAVAAGAVVVAVPSVQGALDAIEGIRLRVSSLRDAEVYHLLGVPGH